jgi:hypothetical protein
MSNEESVLATLVRIQCCIRGAATAGLFLRLSIAL